MEVTIEKFNPWKDSLLAGVFMVVIGLLFIALGDEALKWILVIAGVLILLTGALALYDAMKTHFTGSMVMGGLQIIIGIVLIVAANLWADLLMIILGAVLVVIGLMSLFNIGGGIAVAKGSRILTVIIALIFIIMGVLAILNPDSAADFIMIVIGVFTLIAGLLMLYEGYQLKKVSN